MSSKHITAMRWVSNITTISIEMVVPSLIGLYIDKKLDTQVLFMLIGLVIGNIYALWHLLKLVKNQ